MEKEYYADVRIDWGTSFQAENKEDFIIKLKEQFKDDFNIELTDDEIHNVQGGKEDEVKTPSMDKISDLLDRADEIKKNTFK